MRAWLWQHVVGVNMHIRCLLGHAWKVVAELRTVSYRSKADYACAGEVRWLTEHKCSRCGRRRITSEEPGE